MRLAEHHVTTAGGQAMPGALGIGTPVKFNRPPQDAAHAAATTATSRPWGVPSGALPVRGIEAGMAQTVRTFVGEAAPSSSSLPRAGSTSKRRERSAPRPA